MKKVRSVCRAIRILEAFQDGSSPTITELSRSLTLPKSSVYELLATLVAEGLVIKEPSSNRYRLGWRLVELARAASNELDVRQVARPFIEKLRNELNETVQLTVLDGDQVLYVDGRESTRPLRTFFESGDRAPLYCTALGKAILACLPARDQERFLRRKGLRPFTTRTLTDPAALRRDLVRTAARGYSIDDREHEESVRCVAAPIRDREGRPFASISVSGPEHRIAPSRDAEIAKKVMKAAGEISRRLGYRPAETKHARKEVE